MTRKLRSGFTTGTAAAAATKGALRLIIDGKKPAMVQIRFLTGDNRQVFNGIIKRLRILHSLTYANVQGNLFKFRHLHDILEFKPLDQRRNDFFLILLL